MSSCGHTVNSLLAFHPAVLHGLFLFETFLIVVVYLLQPVAMYWEAAVNFGFILFVIFTNDI